MEKTDKRTKSPTALIPQTAEEAADVYAKMKARRRLEAELLERGKASWREQAQNTRSEIASLEAENEKDHLFLQTFFFQNLPEKKKSIPLGDGKIGVKTEPQKVDSPVPKLLFDAVQRHAGKLEAKAEKSKSEKRKKELLEAAGKLKNCVGSRVVMQTTYSVDKSALAEIDPEFLADLQVTITPATEVFYTDVGRGLLDEIDNIIAFLAPKEGKG
jgi:hypothetical protein